MESVENIGVWLVEDDALYRQTLIDLLSGVPSITPLRAFASCEAALEALASAAVPDVVVMDIGLPGMSGIDGTREVKSRHPDAQIIMLTINEDDGSVFEALCAGASGYLLKNTSVDRFLQAIQEVHRGGVPFTAPVARKVLQLFATRSAPATDYGLTAREREVLTLLAEGHTQKHIAAALFISPHTVDTHLRHLYAKLHVHNGLGAVAKAIRERLI